MPHSDINQRITHMTTPLAASLGLELWGIEVAFGPQSFIRVYVEGEEGVSIEQCVDLSRLLGLGLEVEDVMPGPYTLEVSSPGLERLYFTPEQLAKDCGERIELVLRAPLAAFPGRKKFWGRLVAVDEQVFSLAAEDINRPVEQESEGEDEKAGEVLVRFAFAEARKIKRLYVEPEKIPPGKKAGAKKATKPKARENSVPDQVAEIDE